jgi:hypothetical protein
MNVQRMENLVLAIGRMNGAFDDPETRAFKLRNPLLLKTYRPEKQCDSDHYRVFSSLMGGFKAGLADLQAKCSGKSNRLTLENSLKDAFAVYGFSNEGTVRKLILFLRRALSDENISANTPLSWLMESTEPQIEPVLQVQEA